MSSTNDFIAELVRAANQVEKLGHLEKSRLLDRAIITIRELREAAGIPNSHTTADGLIDLQISAVALARRQRNDGQIQAAMLAAAGMIRDLHIVLDTETQIKTER